MPTANMGLTEPTDHGSLDVWGAMLNAAFDLIDAHDHTAGKGVKVASAALKINADVSWSFGGTNYALTDALALDFAPTAASSITGYSSALFVNSSDANNLYFRNASGTNVKITDGSTLNVSIVGGIGGDYASVGAHFTYDDASKTYWAKDQNSKWAAVGAGNVDLYEKTTSVANRVRLQSPGSLAASYTVTWPAAVPGAQSLVQMGATGTLVLSSTLANNTDITLSGTGKIKHDAYAYVSPFVYNKFKTGSAITKSDSAPGVSFPPNSTAWYPIEGLPVGASLVSVLVYTDNADSNSTTYSLQQLQTSAGHYTNAFTGDVAGSPITSALPEVVVTPTSPIVIVDGQNVWLKIVTANDTHTRIMMSIEVTIKQA